MLPPTYSAEGTRQNPIVIDDDEDGMEVFRAEEAMKIQFPPRQTGPKKKKKKKTPGGPMLVRDEDEEILRRSCPLETYLTFQRQEDAVNRQLQNRAEGRCWYDSSGWHCRCEDCGDWTPAPKYFPPHTDLSTGVAIPPLVEMGSMFGSYAHVPQWFRELAMQPRK